MRTKEELIDILRCNHFPNIKKYWKIKTNKLRRIVYDHLDKKFKN